MKHLDLTSFPLDGLALIEASAGTGKTYALSNLYLRYLLEKGLSVEQILVVTFTEAATQELKERIRQRIGELVLLLEREPDASEIDDDTLRALYQGSTQHQGSTKHSADLIRLRLAERQMDQAEIYTIHGFCQRMLSEYALDSGLGLSQTLVEDQRPIVEQHAQDFWRHLISSLPKDGLGFLYQTWSGPDSLVLDLMPLFNRQPEVILPRVSGGMTEWLAAFEAQKTWIKTLKAQTLAHWDEVYELVSKSHLKRLKNKLQWLEKIHTWCSAEGIDFALPQTSTKESLFSKFTPSVIEQETKAKQAPPEHSYFQFLDDHLSASQPPLVESFKVLAFETLREQVAVYKTENSLLGFDDLISKLSDVVAGSPEQLSPPLIQRIRQRYDVALIDEFQDTDKAQYKIFSTLFGPLANEQAKNLVLIGDPKQAIYAFRGGDIATYLLAKHEVLQHPRGELFTMDRNWRSAPEMIAGVNHLFDSTENPFMEEDIPFRAVLAGSSAQSQNASGTALTITQLNASGLKKEQILIGLANRCVNQIQDLLKDGRYQSADIAILVRSGNEAELVKACLSQAGISASFEGKANIYESEEAMALSLLLAAVAEPGNETLMRRCLAEPFWGVSDERYHEMSAHPALLGHYFDCFKQLHDVWLTKGVLAMIREALVSLNVFDHWQRLGLDNIANGWERRLSNINQLAEILQQQSRTYRSEAALVRWLHQQLMADHMADDETRMRLESDEQLIRIVTIHKSKGLEYPVVFLPFLFSSRGADEAWFYDEQGNMTLDLTKSDAHLLQADQERLAEDMRLLYVALTRAKYVCYIGTCAYQSKSAASLGLPRTAWGYLCFQGEPPTKVEDDALYERLAQLAAGSSGTISVVRIDLEAVEQGSFVFDDTIHEAPEKDQRQAKTLSRNLYSPWRVTSFTGIMHEHHLACVEAHQLLHTPSPEKTLVKDAIDILNFPKGSRAGTFLHTLFENIVFDEGGLLPALQPVYPSLQEYIQKQLELSHLVEDKTLTTWAAYLTDWLPKVLATELLPGICLNQLGPQQYISEMAFHFPIDNLKADRLNQILNAHGYDFALVFADIEGHLKGAIDLIFEAQGQFYVLDYKSNYLGDLPEHYGANELSQVMLEHRYDLQYLLYTLALHRYLKHRLGDDYDYEQAFGGVVYLFLRGLTLNGDRGDRVPGIYHVKPSFALIDALDQEVSKHELA